MAGKLDEISRIIGNIEAKVENMSDRVDDNRRVADERHRENLERLETIDARTMKLESTVAPLAATVGKIEPIVESYQATRWKLAGMSIVVLGILSLLGWALSLVAGKALGWVMSLFVRG
jgi:hypothetical protein